MDISLRKADALFKKALEAATQLAHNNPIFEYNIHDQQGMNAAIQERATTVRQGLNQAVELMRVAYRIRDAADQLGQEIGVAKVLRRRKALELEEGYIASVLSTRKPTDRRPSMETLLGQLEAMREKAKTSTERFFREGITLDALSVGDVQDLTQRLATIRLAKSGFDEELLKLNMNTITLAINDVKVLQSHNLI